MSKRAALGARERARAASIARYAKQAARQQTIEDRVTEFYLAADALEAAETAAAEARDAMAAAVQTLISELKEPISGVAALCGITTTQVRALRKAAKTATPSPAAGKTLHAQTDQADQAHPDEAIQAPTTGADGAGEADGADSAGPRSALLRVEDHLNGSATKEGDELQ